MDIEPVFVSGPMRRILSIIDRVAKTKASVVITGETGTGKEVLAKLIHGKSGRNGMVSVNCAALPHELVESELFGSVRGSFTGASADRRGLFEQADGGTLLLDEMTDMPLDMQPKLLRVVQDGEVRPVGSTVTKKVSVRFISTLNCQPQIAVRNKQLRPDLYYRLSTVWIHIPPLRQRKDDILPIAKAYLAAHSKEIGVTHTLSKEAEKTLMAYDWPGNVRQLHNEIHRAVILCDDPMRVISPYMFSAPVTFTGARSSGVLSPLQERERDSIIDALEATHGNKLAAAKLLGIGRQTLYNKVKSYGVAIAPNGAATATDRLDVVTPANAEDVEVEGETVESEGDEPAQT